MAVINRKMDAKDIVMREAFGPFRDHGRRIEGLIRWTAVDMGTGCQVAVTVQPEGDKTSRIFIVTVVEIER